MRKILSVIIFFMLVGGTLYVIKNIDPKEGVKLDDIKKVVSNIEAKLKDKKSIETDIKNLGAESQKALLNLFKEDNLNKGKGISEFLNFGKYIGKEASDTFYSIAYENFSKNTNAFVKESLKLDTEDLNKIFTVFVDKYIEKPKFIEKLQEMMKSNSLSTDEKEKLNDIITKIK